MRILAISDEVSGALYHANLTQLTGAVDVVLGCGDLPYDYMEYIVTQTRVRDAYFVHGNHDEPLALSEGEVIESPGGWENVDRAVVYVKDLDLIVGGLEGSIRYSPGGLYQYTEAQMRRRAQRLVLRLLLMRVMHGRFLDILITHAPPAGIHDSRQGAHRGFRVFLGLMRRFRPRLLLHGHNRRYGLAEWRTQYRETEVINIEPFCIIDYEQGHLVAGGLHHG